MGDPLMKKAKSAQIESTSMPLNNHSSDEYSLPRATLLSLIKEYIPENVRMSTQAQELLISLTTTLLHQLSNKSNEMCNLEEKKTITPQHAAQALK